MAKSDIQKELRELKSERAKLDERIRHLEAYLGTYSDGLSTPSTRGAGDIRPAIKEILTANGNQPMRVKDIVEAVAKKMGMDEIVVGKKMEYAKRDVLEKDPSGTYGMYRLKPEKIGGG